MKTLIYFLLLTLWPASLIAQLTDDFSDGDFTNNPTWLGNTDQFIVNPAFELQLNDNMANTSFLYLPASISDSTLWEFKFRLDFNPSASNQLTIVLQSDQSDLSEDFQGYVLRMGASGSDDAIELRRQNGGSSTLILEGMAGGVATSPEVRVRVIRDQNFNWSLLADYTGGTDFQLEGTGFDDTYPSGEYVGILCEYTVSNDQNFFFDDILVGPIILDEEAPVLISAQADNSTTVSVTFDEALDNTSAENAGNYNIDNGITIQSAALNANQSSVTLNLTTPLINGTAYTLNTNNIEDIFENISGNQSTGFSFFEPEDPAPFDLIINEILADEAPPQDLPEGEFVEIFNRSAKAIDLEGIRFSDNMDTVSLPTYILPPNAYVILCDDEDLSDYQNFGEAISVNSLPGLNNAGDELSLISSTNELLHRVNYSSSWYRDSEKAMGGWTLELINPNLVCLDTSDNWIASNNLNGGTPGQSNSVLELSQLELEEAFAVQNDQITLLFNTVVNDNAANPGFFSIDGGAGNIIDAQFTNDPPNEIILTIESPFLQNQQAYTVTASSGLTDCLGNPIDPNQDSFTFTYYDVKAAEPFDLVINEIHADPEPIVGLPIAEYIEIHNRSDLGIQLEGYSFTDIRDTSDLPRYIIPPNGYLTLTDQNNAILLSGFGPTLGLENFPSLSNSGETLQIIEDGTQVIHEVSYERNWFQDAFKEEGGYSLELINPEQICKPGAENWTGSNANLGGTPGQQNSVFDNSNPDVEPPSLKNVIAFAPDSLLLFFDEPLNYNATDLSFFDISGGAGPVQWIDFLNIQRTTIILAIDPPFFQEGSSYIMSIDALLSDCLGNPISSTGNSFEFEYLSPQPASQYDILINEIFPDPTLADGGTIGLPDREFVELYNRSSKAINLAELIYADASDEIRLPIYIMQPGEYLILYDGNDGVYDPFGNSLGLTNFLSLGNAFDDIKLLDANGNFIHAISYAQSWYQDTQKDDGGWSIELINPEDPCQGADNWRASVNPTGGTPGAPNSLLDALEPDMGPDLIRAFPVSDNQVRLFFNEAVDISSAGDIDNYQVQGLNIDTAFAEAPFFNSVIVVFENEIAPNITYEIFLRADFFDCTGIPVGMFNTTSFRLPDELRSNSIVINEILFDPETGGVDFVELYNRSDSTFNIADFQLATLSDPLDPESPIESVTNILTDYLLFPDDYVVLTTSSLDIINRYDCRSTGLPICEFDPYKIIENALPSLPDNEGSLVLRTTYLLDTTIRDLVIYEDDYHNELLDDENGVSLERIDPDGNSLDPNNWQSAAEAVGFATPTYRNSQFFGQSTEANDPFSIPKEVFSPNGDGIDDLFKIDYQTNSDGFSVNIRIFDAQGREVKRLVDNELLAREGFFIWDGSTDSDNRARIGIYVIWIELFNPEGVVEHYKKTCVVAGRLD